MNENQTYRQKYDKMLWWRPRQDWNSRYCKLIQKEKESIFFSGIYLLLCVSSWNQLVNSQNWNFICFPAEQPRSKTGIYWSLSRRVNLWKIKSTPVLTKKKKCILSLCRIKEFCSRACNCLLPKIQKIGCERLQFSSYYPHLTIRHPPSSDRHFIWETPV